MLFSRSVSTWLCRVGSPGASFAVGRRVKLDLDVGISSMQQPGPAPDAYSHPKAFAGDPTGGRPRPPLTARLLPLFPSEMPFSSETHKRNPDDSIGDALGKKKCQRLRDCCATHGPPSPSPRPPLPVASSNALNTYESSQCSSLIAMLRFGRSTGGAILGS
jgi:hypothetical protein